VGEAPVTVTGGTGTLGRQLRSDLSARDVLLLGRHDPDVGPRERWRSLDLAAGPFRLSVPSAPVRPGSVLCALAYADGAGVANIALNRHTVDAVNDCPDITRAVLVSELSVYGDPPGAVTEASPCRPRDDAARTRLACERVWRRTLRPDCELVVLRPSPPPGGLGAGTAASGRFGAGRGVATAGVGSGVGGVGGVGGTSGGSAVGDVLRGLASAARRAVRVGRAGGRAEAVTEPLWAWMLAAVVGFAVDMPLPTGSAVFNVTGDLAFGVPSTGDLATGGLATGDLATGGRAAHAPRADELAIDRGPGRPASGGRAQASSAALRAAGFVCPAPPRGLAGVGPAPATSPGPVRRRRRTTGPASSHSHA
jgi:nucleoside-diphosphate-sugar epimerase